MSRMIPEKNKEKEIFDDEFDDIGAPFLIFSKISKAIPQMALF